MEHKLSGSQRAFVQSRPTIGYEEKPAATKSTKIFAKPNGYRPPSVRPAALVVDDNLDWEIDLAIDFEMSAMKPLLRLPANLFRAAA